MSHPHNGMLFDNKRNKSKESTDTWDNMDEPCKHDMKWKSQGPHTVWFHVYEIFRTGKSQRQRLVVVGVRRGKQGMTALGMGFLLEMMKVC